MKSVSESRLPLRVPRPDLPQPRLAPEGATGAWDGVLPDTAARPTRLRSAPIPSYPPPYALVCPDRTTTAYEGELTYAVPPTLQASLSLGSAVLIPFGRGTATGYVTGYTEELSFSAEQLKAVDKVLAQEPAFDEAALRVARWMSSYYHCPLWECLASWVPHGWQIQGGAARRRYSLPSKDQNAVLRLMRDVMRSPRRIQILQLLAKAERPLNEKEMGRALEQPATKLRPLLETMLEAGQICAEEEAEADAKARVAPRKVLAARALSAPQEVLDKLIVRAPRRFAAWQHLAQKGDDMVPLAQLARETGLDHAAWRALAKAGLAEIGELEIAREVGRAIAEIEVEKPVQLSDEQRASVKAIVGALRASAEHAASDGAEAPATILLHGVTASGKTEVYLRTIEGCLTLGRRAVVIVPEIALTAQTVAIFRRRFGERVAILHSALSPGERFDEWRRARDGRADIVVGARSAVFAPCQNIGLFVMDEEHDGSYKQDSMPRYNARDVALKRAQMEGAVVVLGSATPSIESYYRAQKGEYGYVTMTQRVQSRPLPQVEIVDMTSEVRIGAVPALSRRLKNELIETVKRGEQVILFLNRRGFAPCVQCVGCGHVEKCPNCDVTLTFHRAQAALRCHHCDHSAAVIETCPKCKSWMIGFSGTGTEKVEAEVRDLLRENCVDGEVLRLDRDTTTTKGSHARIISEFRAGRAPVLIGTQMVTKGLDFPRVTLVGVISADTALNVPDFRAAERTFQLLTQVAGRAGRGTTPGRVLVQTLAADHPAILAAQNHDYLTFVTEEIGNRQNPPYPPFSHVVNVIASDESEGKALSRIQHLAMLFSETIARLEKSGQGGTELLGPVDCPLARVKNKYRFHLMLRDRNRPRLHKVLAVYDKMSREEREGLTIDVDAHSML